MEVEFMTADIILLPCMPLPRAMLRLPISSTAKVMYAWMLDIVFVSGIEDAGLILRVRQDFGEPNKIYTHSQEGGQPPMNEKLEVLNQEIEKTEKKLWRAQNEDEFFKRRVGYGLSVRCRYEGGNPCRAERNRAGYP